MQEALQNENFRKVWEAVIRNRHPETKSLEEALKMETQFWDCLAILPTSDNRCEPYNIHKNIIKDGQLKIISRPITLEDIK